MGNSINLFIIALLLVLLLYQVWRLLQVGRRPKDFPPGPPTIPILGNIHQVRSLENICIRAMRIMLKYERDIDDSSDSERRCAFAISKMGAGIWTGVQLDARKQDNDCLVKRPSYQRSLRP